MRTFLLLMLFAGCGEVAVQSDSGVQDAGSDGAIDAVSIDADLTGTANVVTLAHLDHQGAGPLTGQPAGNIDVVSLRPDGSVAGMIKTNGAGQASIPVYPGGTVTAIYPRGDGAGAELVTFADVKAGDMLTFGREVQNQEQTTTNITVSLPNLIGASYYYVLNDCNYNYINASVTGGRPTTLLTDSAYCHGSDTQVLLALAYDSSDNLKASMSMPITYSNNGTYAFSDNWVTAPTASLTVSGLSPEISSSYLNLSTALYKHSAFQAGAGGQLMGNAISAVLPFPPAGPRALAQVELFRSGAFGRNTLFYALPTSNLTLTVNAPALPPWLSAAVINPALGGAAWFPVGGAGSSGLPSSHDAVVGQMYYVRNDGSNYLFSWTFIVSPTETEFKLPVLPAPFESLQPRVNDYGSGTLSLLEVPSADGYDDARALPESSLACPRCAVRDGILPRATVSDSPGGMF